MQVHTEIVKRLGGALAVSRMLNIPRRTVSSWMTKNQIPAQHHNSLFEAANQFGIVLRPSDFFAPQWAKGTAAASAADKAAGQR